MDEEDDDKIAVTRCHLKKKDVVANVMTTRRKSGSVGGSGSASNAMVNAESVISSASSSLLPPLSSSMSSSSSSSSLLSSPASLSSSPSSLHIKESKGKVEVKVVSQTARDDNEHDNDNDKVDNDDEDNEEGDKTAVHHLKMKDVIANVMTTRRKSKSIGESGSVSNAMVNAESVISSALSSSSLLPLSLLHTKDSNGRQKAKVVSQTARDDNEHDGDEESGEEDDSMTAAIRHFHKEVDIANVMATRGKSRSIGGSNEAVNAESVISSASSSSSLLPSPSSSSAPSSSSSLLPPSLQTNKSKDEVGYGEVYDSDVGVRQVVDEPVAADATVIDSKNVKVVINEPSICIVTAEIKQSKSQNDAEVKNDKDEDGNHVEGEGEQVRECYDEERDNDVDSVNEESDDGSIVDQGEVNKKDVEEEEENDMGDEDDEEEKEQDKDENNAEEKEEEEEVEEPESEDDDNSENSENSEDEVVVVTENSLLKQNHAVKERKVEKESGIRSVDGEEEYSDLYQLLINDGSQKSDALCTSDKGQKLRPAEGSEEDDEVEGEAEDSGVEEIDGEEEEDEDEEDEIVFAEDDEGEEEDDEDEDEDDDANEDDDDEDKDDDDDEDSHKDGKEEEESKSSGSRSPGDKDMIDISIDDADDDDGEDAEDGEDEDSVMKTGDKSIEHTTAGLMHMRWLPLLYLLIEPLNDP